MINVVIPMAGAGSRFLADGFDKPKPFIDVNGKMMIERVLDGVSLPDAHYTLIIQERFREENGAELERLSERYRTAFVTVEKLTQGACCTALAAFEIINNNLPVIFADSDNIFTREAFAGFAGDCLARGLDGSLLTFASDEGCFSYAETDAAGVVVRTREKEVISRHAIAGAYMFARGADFVRAAINMMIYGDKAKNEYYMSNVYNHAARLGLKTGVYDIAADAFACVGTPRQLKEYLER